MYPGGSPGVPPAPDTLIPQPAGESLSEEKDLKKQLETQEPGSSYREKGEERELVRVMENSNAAKRAFSDN